jgi:hypothetical protein
MTTVTLQSDGITYILENANIPKVASAKGLQDIKVAVASISNLGEHSGVSPLRQREAMEHLTHCSADNALPTIPHSNEAEPSISPGQCNKNAPRQTAAFLYSIAEIRVARSSKKRSCRKLQRQRQQERKLVVVALHTVWDELERTADPGMKRFVRKVHHIRWTRDLLHKSQLRRWAYSRWDFGCVDIRKGDSKTKAEEDDGEIELPKVEPCRKATVEDCPEDETFAEGVRNFKVTVVSASNLGVRECMTPLKQRQVSDDNCPEDTDEHFEQDTPVMSVEEVKQSLDGMSPSTEQPEIAVNVDQSIYT